MPAPHPECSHGAFLAKVRIPGAAALLLGAATACSSGSGGAQSGSAHAIALFAGVASGEGFADGQGAKARFYQPSAAARDLRGNLMVADFENHTIRKISPSGAVSTLAGTPGLPGSTNGGGAAALFNFPSGLALGPDGNTYVADGNNLIRMVTPQGLVTPVAGTSGVAGSQDGPGASASFNNPNGLAFDGSGNLYVADTGNNTIRKLTPAGGAWAVTTFAGTAGVTGSADGTGAAASFNGPAGLAVDGAQNLYVADTGNQIIRTITPAGVVTTFAGTAGVTGSADGTGAAASFNGPWGLAFDGSGNLCVADSANGTIRKITASGLVSTWAGTAGVAGSADDTGAAASFRLPYGLAGNGAGTIYVTDFHNNTLRVISPARVVSTLAGSAGAPGFIDGTGQGAWFNHPGRLALDAAGNTYVPDSYNNVIRKIAPSGEVTLLAGTPGVTGSADGTGAAAQFNYPRGVVVDAAGNVYVADAHNNTIRMITPAGVVSTLAGTAGVAGSANGAGGAALFSNPDALALDGSGNLYLTEYDNNTVRKMTPSGGSWVVSTVAGTAGVTGSADGTGAAASFNAPDGVVMDSLGNLFVADSRNNTIRKITPAGVVTTFAGTPGTGGGADGAGATASFNLPADLAMDGSGNLYVTDFYNGTIRAITQGGVVTTIEGVAGAGATDLANVPPLLSDPFGIAVDPTTGNLLISLDDAILRLVL